jgi:hypothetical protein
VGALTLILPDVLESKGETGVFPLDDADLAKGALADDAQQAEVVEIDCSKSVSVVRVEPCLEAAGGGAGTHLGR